LSRQAGKQALLTGIVSEQIAAIAVKSMVILRAALLYYQNFYEISWLKVACN
jgi:hypothetical protein